MVFSNHTLARRLRLQQVVILEQVLSSGTISAASRELHLTQPAISKAVQELEDHFGRPLLTRSSRGVSPTDFGLMVQKHAKSLMTELRYLADDINAWNDGVSGKVMVGTLLAASAQLLPQAIIRMREIAPNVVVQVNVGINEAMFADMLRGQIDVVVGLVPGHAASTEVEHKVLFEESMCAVVGRHHPLAMQSQLDLGEVRQLDWILPTPDSEANSSAELFFDAIGIPKPVRIVESVSIMTSLGLLVDSNMVALMPFSVARKFVQLGLITMLPLPHTASSTQVGYTLAKGRSITPATARLLQALEEVADSCAASSNSL